MIKALVALSAVGALGACGGGSGGNAALESAQLSQTTIFSTAQPSNTRPLRLITARQDNASVGVETASLDYTSRVGADSLDGTVISGSSLAGTIFFTSSNGDFDYEVDLNSGGLAFLAGAAADTEYMFVFTSGARSGVAGERADALPTGTATYNGSGNVSVNDGGVNGVKQINGNATITARFNIDQVDVSISESGKGTITIDDANISGTQFSGGSLTLTGSFLTKPTRVGVDHDGSFFGPGAAEAGGAFAYRNTGAAPIEILGVYSGKR